MYANNQLNSHPSAQTFRILWKQQQELIKKSPDGVVPIINSEDPLDIQADILGPKGTPYEGGVFRVKLFIPAEFPQCAPKGFFITKIYHPNVSEKGEICVNTLKKDWNPRNWSLYNLFEVIKCLLIVPFPESSLNEEAGKIFMENYEKYCKIAKIYTNVHAIKKIESDILVINNSFQRNIIANGDIEKMREEKKMDMEIDEGNTKEDKGLGVGKMENCIYKRERERDGSFQYQSFKSEAFSLDEKPKLGALPFIRSNSLRVSPSNLFSNQSKSNNSNEGEQNKKNNKEEINKWLLRI